MRKFPDNVTIVEEFRGHLMLERGLSANTAEAYTFDLGKLLAFTSAEGLGIPDIAYTDLEQFAASLYDLGIAESTRKRIVAGIRTFFHFLVISGYLDDDPSLLLETPVTGLHLPEVLTVDEIDRMIDAIDLSTPEGIRNRAIVETLYGCGLRVSELVNMEFSQIMADEEFLRVRGKGDKERMVPMSPVSLERISEYVDGPRAALTPPAADANIVFLNRRGKRLTRQMIFTIVRRLAEAADIRRTISPHTLRHSFATHLLEGGANLRAIQQMMGHESISTTEIYLNIDTSHLREEILLHHPRNRR